MLSVVMGLLVAGVSLAAMFRCWAELWTVLRGLLPLSFFLGGVIAVVAGVSSLKRGVPSDKKLPGGTEKD